MKQYLIVAIACFIIAFAAALFIGCASIPPDRAKAIADMNRAKYIHELWLAAPENPDRGNHKWHRMWVESYENCINVLMTN